MTTVDGHDGVGGMSGAESRAVEMVIDARRRPVGAGEVRRLLPYRKRRMVGPFIFADLIGPDELAPAAAVSIDAHPHIGLSTLTYLFDGRLVHRDSTGAVQTIEPGAVNWMTAGAGVAHTERSHPDDIDTTTTVFGLQTWVALPDRQEDVAPSFQHVDADAVPVESAGQSRIRLVAGRGWGLNSPVSGSSPMVLAGLSLVDGSPVRIESYHRERAVVAVDGSVSVNGEPLRTGQLAVLEPGSAPAVGGQGTVVVLGGEPVGRRHIWWNFVHSDPERIEQAKDDWRNRRFAPVPDDNEPRVPLPGS